MAECGQIDELLLAPGRSAAEDAELAEHLEMCAGCATRAELVLTLDGALARLSEQVLSPPDFAGIEPAAAGVARQRRRLGRARRLLPYALAAAAGMVVVVVAALLLRGGTPAEPLPRPLAAGEVLETSSGPAQATLAGGARVTVVRGRLGIEASTPTHTGLRLERGQVVLEVPRLASGTSLTVSTAEAEVIVQGTRFSVAAEAEGTRVEVSEGVVELRPRDPSQPSSVLRAGDAALIEAGERRQSRLRGEALAALEHGRGAEAEACLGRWLATGPPAIDAAQAHALLGWKLHAEGDRAGAMASFRRALAELPAGATALWADNASAQLALLAERDDLGAAWRAYLERFPDGTHARQARARLAAGRHEAP